MRGGMGVAEGRDCAATISDNTPKAKELRTACVIHDFGMGMI